MVKVMVEVELPEYKVKYCDDILYGQCCDFLQRYDYGFKQYCILSKKDITKTKHNGDRVCRPYGCRCLVKNK